MSSNQPVFFSSFRSALGVATGPVNFSDLYNINIQVPSASNTLKASDMKNIQPRTVLYNQLTASATSGTLGVYSLRNALSNYSGPVVRLRRNNDNAFMDFYSDRNGNLKTLQGIKVRAWLSGNRGFVTTWYDQSSNARHAQQSFTANQPWLEPDPFNSGRYSIFFNGNSNPTGFDITAAATQSVAVNYYTIANPSLWQSFVCTASDNQGLRIANNTLSQGDGNDFLNPGGFAYFNNVKVSTTPYATNIDAQWNYLVAARASGNLSIIHIGYPDRNFSGWTLSNRAFNGYMSEIKLFSNQLSDVDCQSMFINMLQPNWGKGLLGYYTGESWATTQWTDISGNSNNVTTISGSIAVNSNKIGLSRTYLSGAQTSRMTWPSTILPSSYTLFHVTKYNNGIKRRIFDGSNVNWLSGFWNGYAGVAFHNNFITATTDLHGYDWVLSSDQNALYRSQGVSRTSASPGTPSHAVLTIMNGDGSAESSEWAVASLLVYNRTLATGEIRLVEDMLAHQYKLPYPIQNGLIAGFDASQYASAPSTLIDISGNGNGFTVANTGIFTNSNGIPCFDCSSLNHMYFTAGNTGASSSNATIIIFSTIKNSTGTWRTLFRGISPNNQQHQVIIDNGVNFIGMYDNDTGGGFISSGFNITTLPQPYDQFNMYTFKMSAIEPPYWELYINNNPTALARISDPRAAFKAIRDIGGTAGSQNWGRLGTFLYYNRILNFAEINETYLRYAPRYKTQFFANIWLDAKDLSGSAGTSITSWPNKGSLGTTYDAVGSSVTLQSDASGNMVRFASGGHIYIPGTITWNLTIPLGITFITVARFTSLSTTATYDRLLDFGNGPNANNIVFARYVATSNITSDYRDGATVRGASYTSGFTLDPNFHVFSVVYQNGGPPTQAIYVDGISQTLTYTTAFSTSFTTSKTTASNFIGKSAWAADAIFTGDQREFIAYNYALNSNAIRAISFSLQNKWGLSSTLHPPVRGMQGPSVTSGTIATPQSVFYGRAGAIAATFRLVYAYLPGTSGSARYGSSMAGSGYSTPSPITLALFNTSYQNPQVYVEFTSAISTFDGIELVLQRSDGTSPFYDVCRRSDLVNVTSVLFDFGQTENLDIDFNYTKGVSLLDKLSSTTSQTTKGMYSLRRISSTYTGPTLTVRRSFDNVTQDFFADTSGNLGTYLNGLGTSVSNWLSSNIGYITTWHDQSGKGNHATQTTPGSQPILNITSNFVDFKPNLFFNLPNDTVPSGNSRYTVIIKHRDITSTTGGMVGSGNYGTTNGTNAFRRSTNGYTNYWWLYDYTISTGYAQGNTVAFTYDTATRASFFNNVSQATAASSGRNSGTTNNTIGVTNNSEFLNGELYYVYMFSSNISAGERQIF